MLSETFVMELRMFMERLLNFKGNSILVYSVAILINMSFKSIVFSGMIIWILKSLEHLSPGSFPQ